jgi:ribonuclease Z
VPDNAYRQAHHGDKWFSGGMRAHVIEALPGLVYEESGVRVTMFEVDHRPVEPAMGFRFDYAGLSVVISGDTKKVPQMVELAGNCDLLIHEAVNRDLVLMALAGLKKGNPRLAAMSEEMMEYHTSTLEVAEIARDANVGKLVLTHLVPSIPPRDDADQLFIRGMNEIYHGPIIVGRDQMEIKVAP